MSGWIDDELYAKIRQAMPIPTVDAIITFSDTFLLVLRNNPPVKDTWWIPGGRVMRGEHLEDAVLRHVREETSLIGETIRQVGVINQVFPEVHTISVYFHVPVSNDNVTLNGEHRAYQWASTLPKSSHPFLKRMVVDTLGNSVIEA
jgi:ADP-ribose pyrophosphatase YjhB (NUDIX family)